MTSFPGPLSYAATVCRIESLEGRLFLHGDQPHVDSGFERGSGLLAQYFNDARFADLQLTRTDPAVNFQWGRRSPAPGQIARNEFSVRWSGQVLPHETGRYTFHLKADDGVCVWLNGRPVVERMYGRGAAVTTFEAELVAGQKAA